MFRPGGLPRRLVWAVLGLAATLAVAEAGLRLALPDWAWLSCFELSPGPEIPCIRPVPGCTGRFTGFARAQEPVPFQVNPLGFRGPVPAAVKTGPRILVFGASNVFGLSLPEGSTFADVLARHLGAGVEVVNLGSPGHDLRQQMRLAEEQASLSPDLLVFMVTGEQMMPTDCDLWARTVTPATRRWAILRALSLAFFPPEARDDRLVAETAAAAGRWRAARPGPAAMVVALAPLGSSAAHEDAVRFLAGAGFRVVDLATALAPVLYRREPAYLSPNGEHMSLAAHEKVAERLVLAVAAELERAAPAPAVAP